MGKAEEVAPFLQYLCLERLFTSMEYIKTFGINRGIRHQTSLLEVDRMSFLEGISIYIDFMCFVWSVGEVGFNHGRMRTHFMPPVVKTVQQEEMCGAQGA